MALNYYCIQQHNVAKVTSDGIEPPLSDLESEVLPLHHEAMEPAQTYPSGYGARLLSECALHAQVRTLPSASFCNKWLRRRGLNPGLLGEGQVS